MQSPSNDEPPSNVQVEYEPPSRLRTYWWRWWVLFVFVLNMVINNVTWITFAPVADIMRCYYGISNAVVNTLSMSSAILTLLLVLPAAWSLAHWGLRFTILLSSAATALGAGLRVMGVGSSYFSLLIVGQVVSSFNGLISGAVTLFSETWFPSSERATSTALVASIAPEIGVLVAYGLSPILVHSKYTEEVCKNSTHVHSSLHRLEWSETIYNQFFYYLLGQAIACILIFFLTLIGWSLCIIMAHVRDNIWDIEYCTVTMLRFNIAAFPEAPPTPPSLSRLLENDTRAAEKSLLQQLRQFFISLLTSLRNLPFLLFLISAGILIGSAGAIGSLINEMILPNFQNRDRMIAYLGITMKTSSVLGLFLIGRLLDWTKAFYRLWVGVYLMAAISMATFAAVIQYQHYTLPLYIAIAFVGASVSSIEVVSLEYSVEITYPLPEGTSAGFFNFSCMSMATVLILTFGKLTDAGKTGIGIWMIAGVIILGALLAVFVRPELKRLNIDREKKANKNYSISH